MAKRVRITAEHLKGVEPHPIILKHVTEIFRRMFPSTPPSAFVPDLKVRAPYDDNAWGALGDDISNMAWMKLLKVRLSHREMLLVSTIKELAVLISLKAGRAVGRLSGAEFAHVSDVNLTAA